MKIGIYGLGRFGSFWSSCLAKKFDVYCYSRNAQRTAGVGAEKADEQTVLNCDVIFLCVAISAMDDVLRRIGPMILEGKTVIDTCSVKVHPIKAMERNLAAGISIIGTHPMFGPDSGKNGIAGLPMVYCPVRAQEEVSAFWRDAFVDMGLKVYDLLPEEHDREAAYTQGVTHFMGRVLDDLKLEPSRIGTLGYSKLLEIIEQTCNDPFQLFVDLQKFNPFTGEMRKKLGSSLQKMQDQLGSG
ncbi:MAG: prephenate dehydrogenase/arogenate dehydrogenase family protein [Spirochaetales bacterium]|jgi:prephenate dehydrogenase|nr:prephenate dehydrogenase/arogenate dehydrogenase family protein [Spirochaetales bacterium]